MNFATTGGDTPNRRSELQWLLREGLGHPVDERTVDGLADMQAWLQSQQRELVQLLTEKRITEEAYLQKLEDVLKVAATRGESLLGYDDFHRVFGEFNVDSVIDPDAFFSRRPANL
jgi:hypothetical protein